MKCLNCIEINYNCLEFRLICYKILTISTSVSWETYLVVKKMIHLIKILSHILKY